ncbi:MAG TPA: multicopper oxidase domain-containing protein [Gemmatimonadales bacterium]|nr:multicopper oxidase domain-containing protein [Gemmatimonadales bacterium]
MMTGTRPAAPFFVVALLSLTAGNPGLPAGSSDPAVLATAEWNDNLVPGGRLTGTTLSIALEIATSTWHPRGQDHPAGEVLAFSEAGKAPLVPGPLIRVPEGTTIRATVTNRHDKTLVIRGLSSRRAPLMDSLLLAPGATGEARFTADAEGTYYYWAGEPGVAFDDRMYEDSQLNGAYVVDPAGTVRQPDDRVLLISAWVQRKDGAGDPDFSTELLVINGRPWPHTERFTYNVGDSAHWRIVNASPAPHPLHLHGFYFQVRARGDVQRDTAYWAGQRRMGVTELLQPGQTARISFSPDRPGGWIFHCHLNWHVISNSGVGPEMKPTADRMKDITEGHADHDPENHVENAMGGLMLAMYVNPPPGYQPSAGRRTVKRLFIQSDVVGEGTAAMRRFGYVLQSGAAEPATDSIQSPGSTIVLNKGEPTSIWVINRTPEPTQVHWHGVELDSHFDGVVGVGGMKGGPTPPIMPGDSFEVRVTAPRAGSFMYHTHVNDIKQHSRGLWGALLILGPGEKWDADRDFVYQAGESPEFENVLNGKRGEDAFPERQLEAGQPYRFRLMNITMDGPNLRFLLTRNGQPVRWTPIAKDGFDLPVHLRTLQRADQPISIGETVDMEVKLNPGSYAIELRGGGGALVASQKLQVIATQTVEQQVASAVLPMPEGLRAGATVLGYKEAGKLVELRKGTNGMICLADDPTLPAFHVACYHEGMEPFMARGRQLRAEGVTGDQVDTVRYREAKEGKLKLPTMPAALWQMSGAPGSYDAEKNEIKGARSLYVVYIPYATEQSTGLPAKPAPGLPWLMFPGTPKAHIMFIPTM